MSDFEAFKLMLQRGEIGFSLEELVHRIPPAWRRKTWTEPDDPTIEIPAIGIRVDGGYSDFFSILKFKKEDGSLISVEAYE